ncbi:WH1 domain protein (macronuclear) [Tetrahymena thermophila SB210]|uniref:WH1 domain protein n=1 Tax=Tetrahymena thermophila (strain SB210) TaxID=312017 RepID=Q22NU2_TETTS|nr:WH1 domain protein [Tetrahymena thermophila SB210]EAR87069.1 WH1 domain protein [Tetrahymena thermophila SB210]|eukprot:XP_001007314.1 WH1 domain protein [Tetrahymena thermophila SB210]
MSQIQQQNSRAVPEEVKKLLQQVIGNKQTIMSIAIARIFTARSEGEWIYSNLQGILCLVWDREKDNTPFLRLFDIETFDLLFEAEMYIDFHLSYASVNPTFYMFEYMNAFIGLQFISDSEASQFSLKVMTQSLKDVKPEQNIQQQQQPKEKKKEEKEGLFGFRKGLKKIVSNLFQKDGKHNQDAENIEISKPISFQKVTSLQFNIKTNQFDFSNLNDEWKQIFSRAGIQQSDLSNEELAPIIFESVIRFQSHYENQIENKQKESQQQQQQPNQQSNNNTQSTKQQNQTINEASQSIPVAPQINMNIPPPPPMNLNIPPPPPINIPSAPVLDFNSSIKNNNIPAAPVIPNINDDKNRISISTQNKNFDSSQVMNKSSLLDQIKTGNFQLKHVEVNKKDNKANLDISQMDDQAQENLTLYLSKCIAERRKQIRKHKYSSSEESNDSDDDDD